MCLMAVSLCEYLPFVPAAVTEKIWHVLLQNPQTSYFLLNRKIFFFPQWGTVLTKEHGCLVFFKALCEQSFIERVKVYLMS